VVAKSRTDRPIDEAHGSENLAINFGCIAGYPRMESVTLVPRGVGIFGLSDYVSGGQSARLELHCRRVGVAGLYGRLRHDDGTSPSVLSLEYSALDRRQCVRWSRGPRARQRMAVLDAVVAFVAGAFRQNATNTGSVQMGIHR